MISFVLPRPSGRGKFIVIIKGFNPHLIILIRAKARNLVYAYIHDINVVANQFFCSPQVLYAGAFQADLMKTSKLDTESTNGKELPLVNCSKLVFVFIPEIRIHIFCIECILKLNVGYNAQVLEIPFFIDP